MLDRLLLTLACSIVTGCSGIGGAIVGASVTGGLAGSALSPTYWPFEEDSKVLRLECAGKPVEIEVSAFSADFFQSSDKTLFRRDHQVDSRQRLLYHSIVQSDDPPFPDDTETLHRINWLEVLSDQAVVLTIDDVSVTCHGSPD